MHCNWQADLVFGIKIKSHRRVAMNPCSLVLSSNSEVQNYVLRSGEIYLIKLLFRFEDACLTLRAPAYVPVEL
ncbi:hypothetical protein CS542_05070 [Pedobacter sp. IW39]|nr:hypothetical protein CS542_05070 [Pedobacter sp. IW39]